MALLSWAPAVAVTLLLVGPVRGIPLQLIRVVGQHHLDSLQRLGDGSLLQGTAFLQGQPDTASAHAPRGSSHLGAGPRLRWLPGAFCKLLRGQQPRTPGGRVRDRWLSSSLNRRKPILDQLGLALNYTTRPMWPPAVIQTGREGIH